MQWLTNSNTYNARMSEFIVFKAARGAMEIAYLQIPGVSLCV